MVKSLVILSYTVGCLLMTQSFLFSDLSCNEHLSFCGLTIKIDGLICVFWSCNLFFVCFSLVAQGTNKVKESMRAEVIDKCKYLLTLTLTAGTVDRASDHSPRHSRSLNGRDENSLFFIAFVNVCALLWRYRSKQRFPFLLSISFTSSPERCQGKARGAYDVQLFKNEAKIQ